MLQVSTIWIILITSYFLAKKDLKGKKGAKIQYFLLGSLTGVFSFLFIFENALSWYTDLMLGTFGFLTKLVIGK